MTHTNYNTGEPCDCDRPDNHQAHAIDSEIRDLFTDLDHINEVEGYRNRQTGIVHGLMHQKGRTRPGVYLCGEKRINEQYRPSFGAGDARNSLTCDGCIDWIVALQDWSEAMTATHTAWKGQT